MNTNCDGGKNMMADNIVQFQNYRKKRYITSLIYADTDTAFKIDDVNGIIYINLACCNEHTKRIWPESVKKDIKTLIAAFSDI